MCWTFRYQTYIPKGDDGGQRNPEALLAKLEDCLKVLRTHHAAHSSLIVPCNAIIHRQTVQTMLRTGDGEEWGLVFVIELYCATSYANMPHLLQKPDDAKLSTTEDPFNLSFGLSRCSQTCCTLTV